MHRYNTYYYCWFNITDRDGDWDCRDTTPPKLWLENTSSTSVHYMLKSVEFLKFSGALTRDGEPFNRPKMPTIPLEVDISKITDEETPD